MSDTKTRGRPKTGAALSSTERTRRLADKARLALDPAAPLADLADSALLLALPQAFRTRRAEALARSAAELSTRLGVASTDIQPASIAVEPTDNRPVIIPVDSTTTTLPSVPVEPTDIQPFTLAPAAPDARSALTARICQMSDQGHTAGQIAAALNAEGIPTFSGRGIWQPGTIRVLLAAARKN